LVVVGLWFLLACGPEPIIFDPPDVPAHDDEEDGYDHASGKGRPFLCHDPVNGDYVTCPTDGRPPPQSLSCDAAGCHGDTDYVDPSVERHVEGGEAPSCTTCHGQEWSDTKTHDRPWPG
jgi:hypothetical protein